MCCRTTSRRAAHYTGLIYEALFFALALWLRARTANPALRTIWLYVLAYYGLWASADVLILSGVDLGWALRVLPNQLYYAFFVPFVWWQIRREPGPRPARTRRACA